MKQSRNCITRYRVWVPVFLLLCVIGTVSFIAAKYVSLRQHEAEIHASDFHFSSEYLEPQTALLKNVPEFTISDWNTNGITFNIYNYEKTNVSQISGMAIKYKITASGWNVAVKDAAGNSIAPVSDGVYSFPLNTLGTYQTVTLTYAGSDSPDDLDVTVKSIEPYELDLKAKFLFDTDSSPDIRWTKNDDSYILTIQSNGFSGNATITWKAVNMSPDTLNTGNNVDMSAWTNNGTNSIAMESYHTYELRFLMNAPGINTIENHQINASGLQIRLE